MQKELARLPSVDKVLCQERTQKLLETYPRLVVVAWIRDQLEVARLAVLGGNPAPSLDSLIEGVIYRAKVLDHPSLRPLINATGVILHTNLGRAPLSQEAMAAINAVAGGYSNLELDLASGGRGSRQAHAEVLICQLTKAEAALVVNNNASALLLALSALAKGREVILSRGQAVEIGGGFRIPQIMRQSGSKLVEVGTTNRTYITDYEKALTPKTAALLRVHTSNFRIVGFSQEAGLEELVELGQRHSLPVLDDLGSGCLIDTLPFGLAPEPKVQDSIAAGVGLAFFSGDKLLGGPQGGIIVGREALIARLRQHPLARALRIDKLSLAGLVATLRHYLRGEATARIPVWRMIATTEEELRGRALGWAKTLGQGEITQGRSTVGGGSLPGATLPTQLLALGPKPPPQELARRLRVQSPPIIGRIERNRLLLDPRTVLPEEDESLLGGLHQALEGSGY